MTTYNDSLDEDFEEQHLNWVAVDYDPEPAEAPMEYLRKISPTPSFAIVKSGGYWIARGYIPGAIEVSYIHATRSNCLIDLYKCAKKFGLSLQKIRKL